MRAPVTATFLLLLSSSALHAQQPVDTDRDGLSDALEQKLIEQFAPSFQIAEHDCSVTPAQFIPDTISPTVLAEDGTIYGQVFPGKEPGTAEIHYYHLWQTDCGPHGHHLDTEHVATLLHADSAELDSAHWRADYWYAAAHENTVCDVSQITRAETIHAEDRGAKVWISPGKHASYLNETLCRAGCGADHCVNMKALHATHFVNLGEPGHPMSGSAFIASREWPLQGKMSASNFPPAAIARLEKLPDSDIAWFNPGSHPSQQVLADSLRTQEALGKAGGHTSDALDLAGNDTDAAISLAEDKTGNALSKSMSKTKHALGSAAHNTGSFLHLNDGDAKDAPK